MSMMTSVSGASGSVGSSLPKWQLALAVGTPVAALGLGYMYYKSSTKQSTKLNGEKQKDSNSNGTTDKQISINGDLSSKTEESPNEALLKKAKTYKSEGNKYFKVGKYDEAIAQYNQAISICPEEYTEELAIFYQNRAASYEQLKKYSAVKADCTRALQLKPHYIKALLRRAAASEHCNELETSLEDLTAACILERFLNSRTLTMADQVLKKLGRQHAEEYMANKKPVMRSKHFINNYFEAFHNDPIYSKLHEFKEVENTPIGKAIQALEEQRFDDIIPLCTEEINGHKTGAESLHLMEAYLLRGTFYLLLGQHEYATIDLNKVIDDPNSSKELKISALIKRGTMYMQLKKLKQTFKDFETAIALDPNCSDIYHNRGQVNLLMGNIEAAKENFKRAVELNPDLGLVYVQKCFADFRYAAMKRDKSLIDDAIREFEVAIQKFPDCSECYTLYAQILSDMQDFAKADLYYVKAIEKNPNIAIIHVQRGMLQLQWNGNVDKAVEYIKKGLQLDEKCEFAYETLGTIEVQRGNMKEAISLFDKALALSQTIMEMTHLFSLKNAAKAQLKATERLGPDFVHNMSALS